MPVGAQKAGAGGHSPEGRGGREAQFVLSGPRKSGQ